MCTNLSCMSNNHFVLSYGSDHAEYTTKSNLQKAKVKATKMRRFMWKEKIILGRIGGHSYT